jgi:uncharacterized protein YqjF (DUF2071 family)
VDQPKAFLTADWRHLAILNFEIAAEILQPFIPPGTVLDTYKGKTYASVVGLLFENTRVKRVPIPFHRNFEEVNLRFYVRHFTGEEWRRGVVFIKEIVSSVAIATTARVAYNENYVVMEMGHRVEKVHGSDRLSVSYRWRLREKWNHLQAIADDNALAPAPGSLEEFLTDHHWGYTRQRDGTCIEYKVEHPLWPVRRAAEYVFASDIASIYGEQFVSALSAPPTSAYVVDGSAVTVYGGCTCTD